MNILFIDTETNGLPSSMEEPPTNTKNWPEIISLAYVMTDEKGDFLTEQYHVLKRDDLEADQWNEGAMEYHGISYEMSINEGSNIITALMHLELAFQIADMVVAHNIAFDLPVIMAEFHRSLGRWIRFDAPILCTMEASEHLFGKWPKLQDLYKHLFDKEFQGAHNALADVYACGECFFKMVELEIIDLCKPTA